MYERLPVSGLRWKSGVIKMDQASVITMVRDKVSAKKFAEALELSKQTSSSGMEHQDLVALRCLAFSGLEANDDLRSELAELNPSNSKNPFHYIVKIDSYIAIREFGLAHDAASQAIVDKLVMSDEYFRGSIILYYALLEIKIGLFSTDTAAMLNEIDDDECIFVGNTGISKADILAMASNGPI